jgi:predicted phosphodiesterase
MLPDFEMIVHDLGENDVTIIPVSDVHLGAAEHMEQEWSDFCSRVLQKPNVFVTLGGDLVNNNIRSAVGDIWQERLSPSQQKKQMAKMLEPLRDRLLCCVSGNHEFRSRKDCDDNQSYDIMAKLDLEHIWRENIAFVKIQLGKKVRENGNRTAHYERPTYNLVVTHGSGGGIYTGTAVLRAERFGYVIDGMDCLIVGHTHKPFVTQPGKIQIDPRNNNVKVVPFKVISSSSWMEWGGYAARKMLLPSSHSLQTITLSAYKKEMVVTM